MPLRRVFLAMATLLLAGCVPDIWHEYPLSVNLPFQTKEHPDLQDRIYSAKLHWRSAPDCMRGWNHWYEETSSKVKHDELATFCERRQNQDFVALALSGGGAKAATFGGESMFYLDALGFLSHVDMLSSVSGGSLAASYFALSCDDWDLVCQKAPVLDGSGVQQKDLKRPIWNYGPAMEVISHGFEPMVWAGIFNILLPGTKAPVSIHRFANYIDDTYFLSGKRASSIEDGFHFRDLNPRRPQLVLNSTVPSDYRFQIDLSKDSGYLRRRTADEFFHFSFTDFYFRRLGSDLDSYPLGYAVATSAAFPLAIDYGGMLDYRRAAIAYSNKCLQPARSGRQASVDDLSWLNCIKRPSSDMTTEDFDNWVHDHWTKYTLALSDGGANDNQGLIEVFITLAEIALREQRSERSAANVPSQQRPDYLHPQNGDHGLVVVVNASITEVSGIDSPTAPSIVAGIFSRVADAVDVYSAVSYTERRRLYQADMEEANRVLAARQPDKPGDHFRPQASARDGRPDYKDCPPDGIPTSPTLNFLEIGLITLNGYELGNVEVAAASHAHVTDCRNQSFATQIKRQQAAFDHVSKHWHELGLNRIHPQCLFEQSKLVDSNTLGLAKLAPEKAACLRHAARWATALRMDELCQQRTKMLNNASAIPCDSRSDHLAPNVDQSSVLQSQVHQLAECSLMDDKPDERKDIRISLAGNRSFRNDIQIGLGKAALQQLDSPTADLDALCDMARWESAQASQNHD
jgi:hypothetical protein